MKKAVIILLQHVYKHKKDKILIQTVKQFRIHHLTDHTFKMFKIGCLNIKKDKILNQVAHEFRQDRLCAGMNYMMSERDSTS